MGTTYGHTGEGQARFHVTVNPNGSLVVMQRAHVMNPMSTRLGERMVHSTGWVPLGVFHSLYDLFEVVDPESMEAIGDLEACLKLDGIEPAEPAS